MSSIKRWVFWSGLVLVILLLYIDGQPDSSQNTPFTASFRNYCTGTLPWKIKFLKLLLPYHYFVFKEEDILDMLAQCEADERDGKTMATQKTRGPKVSLFGKIGFSHWLLFRVMIRKVVNFCVIFFFCVFFLVTFHFIFKYISY